MVKVCEEQPCSPLPVNNSRQDPCYAPVTSHAASRMTLADVMKNGESGLDDSLGRNCDKEFLRHFLAGILEQSMGAIGTE
jgi:hypothetical protein